MPTSATTIAPPAPATPSPVAASASTAGAAASQISLSVQTSADAVLYGRSVGALTLERLCFGHCDLTLAKGAYRFGLAEGLEEPRESPLIFDLRKSDRLDGQVRSRRTQRVWGAVTLGVGLIAGSIMASIGGAELADAKEARRDCERAAAAFETTSGYTTPTSCGGPSTGNIAKVVSGAALAVLGVAVGGALLSKRDAVNVHTYAQPGRDAQSTEILSAPGDGLPASYVPMLASKADELSSCVGSARTMVTFRVFDGKLIPASEGLTARQQRCLSNAVNGLHFPQTPEHFTVMINP